MKKIFMTGATGYLGTVLLELLFKEGYQITVLCLPDEDVSYVAEYAKVILGDIRDEKLVDIIVDYDFCIHLAGLIDISSRNSKLMFDINVNGTANIANLCHKNKIKLIYSSSVHAIPPLKKQQSMSEITDFDPKKVKGLYSKTKALATKSVIELRNMGLEAMICFPSGIIGPKERRLTNIGQLIADYLTNQLKAYVKGSYNFVDVRDVAEGILLMLKNFQSGDDYLLTGHKVSVKEMLEIISTTSQQPMLKLRLPFWFVYATGYFSELYYYIRSKKPLYTRYSLMTLRTNCNFNYQKAKDKLGFLPRSSKVSLEEMTKWVLDHFIERDNNKFKIVLFKKGANDN